MNIRSQGLLIALVALIIGISVIFALFRKLSDVPRFHTDEKAFRSPQDRLAEKKKRYLGGKEEVITFFSRENGDSKRALARKAVLIRRPGAQSTVFIFHGFMCNKYDIRFLSHSLFSQSFDGKPFNTVTIDFRAHGDIPEGQCCSFGKDEMYDVMGIVDYIKADPQLKDTKRIAYGFSMGAVASILAQSHDPTLFDVAIWDCPFDSTEKLLGRAVEQLRFSVFGYDVGLPGRTLLQKYAYNPYVQSWLKFALKTIAKMDSSQVDTCIVPIDVVEAMGKVHIPLLLIGCVNDDKAPPTAVEAVYEAAQGYKRLWLTNGRGHFDSYFYNPEKYIYKVRRFIQKALDGTINERPLAHISKDSDEDAVLASKDVEPIITFKPLVKP